ncbi:MAG: HEPN domain-containing protein [Pseudomonadota bacterium]
MVNIIKQIMHWRSGADEDWAVARELLDRNRIRHALFFGHLTLEKMLKAHVCRNTGDLAPLTHNLVRLAQLAEIQLSSE